MGILINTGFDVGSSNPIDSRTVKNTTDERDALISDGLVYENLKVYCKDTQTEYRWTGTEWEEVGTGGTVDLSGYAKTYTSLTELGLTADATFQDVVDTLPKGGSALLGTTEFTNYQTIFPYEEGNDQFARVHVVKGTEDGSRVYARWFRKDGVKEAIAIFNINDNAFNGWQILKNQQIYTSLKELGLDASATLPQVVDALKTGESFFDNVKDFTNYQSIFPYNSADDQYAYIHIIKRSDRVHMAWYRANASRHCMGNYDTGNKVLKNWVEYQTEKSDPYACTSYTALTGTEDLFTLPCGHYASAKVDTSYNYPVTDSSNVTAHIYVLGCLNDPANNKGYRIILYFDNKGRMYSINEWWGSFSNGWQKIQTGNNKATLVTNTTTLKLDVTKKNAAWYGAIKVTYLYDTSPAEIEISFKGASDDLRWAVINGQKYVKQITFTQDDSNTAHYTIGIEFSGTIYGAHQAEVIGDFAVINSLTNEAFTGAKTAIYNSPWGKNNGVTLVSAPEDIGLTYPCTSVQLAQAMRNKFNKTINAGAIGIFNCGGKTTTITDAPSDYGLLHIETFGHDRILIRFDGVNSSNYAGSWVGKIQSNNGAFNSITWSKLIYEENLSALNTGITTLNTKTTELNTKIATIENTKIAAINTKIAAIENTTNNSAIKNITDNTLTTTSNTFKVVINTPTSEGYWFIKFKYYISGKEYEALIMSEVYDRYWSGNAPLVSSITSSANSQTNGTWNFSVGIKLSSSVTGVKIVECPSVANLVSFTTGNFTGANTHEKKS